PAKLELFDRNVYIIEPNIEMALALSSEQQEKIEADLMAFKESDELKALKEAAGADPSEKKSYYEAVDAAQKEYLAKTILILDAKQNELVEKANAFAKQIHSDYKGEIAAIMAQIKAGEKTWGDRLALVRKHGQERITEILTPEQITVIRANSPEADPTPSDQ
ncbi:MAG: hypothetical protein ACOYM3_32235, partial [Terrimicrobiaceae bacterium]